MREDKLSQIKLFHRLPDDERKFLVSLSQRWSFSFQQLKQLTEFSADMICWRSGSLSGFYRPDEVGLSEGKEATGKVFQQFRTGYETLKNGKKRYESGGSFFSGEEKFPDEKIVEVDLKGSIMGECPVSSEKTRCCRLKTLDAVQQCGFDCSYCSIQSFYHGDRVRFIKNLVSHLESLELDPERKYHIGTGQSSDSLMWGNRFGLLDSLTRFASKHPNLILELKSKSSRIDYFLKNPPPANMIFTWSLNTPTVIYHEEKGTSSLDKRIESARKMADLSVPVGFHFHPVIWYDGWHEEYMAVVKRLTDTFSPEEVVMLSLGTLTFIRPVLKRIRERMPDTSVLQMPMEECAGKLSYPFEIKKELFTSIYRAFPDSWKDSVFFYMCMEDIGLWQPVFGRSYNSNEEFEEDMIERYRIKTDYISQSD